MKEPRTYKEIFKELLDKLGFEWMKFWYWRSYKRYGKF